MTRVSRSSFVARTDPACHGRRLPWHQTRTSAAGQHPVRGLHAPTKINVRRRPPFSVTRESGTCRPPKFSGAAPGRSAAIAAAPTTCRARATSPTLPGRWPSGSAIASRSSAHSCSTRASTATTRRCSPTRRAKGGIAARYPRVNESWTGNKVGDLYVGSKVNLLSRVSRRADGARRPRHRQAADGQRRRRASAPGKTDVMADLIGSKEIARVLRGRHLCRLRDSRQPGRHSRRRRAHTAGAPASRFRRAARCGCPRRSTATCPRAIARR